MAATVIEWDAAVRAGQRSAPRGPHVSLGDARSAVADLRQFSARAELVVRETTGLGRDLPVAEACVVDRNGWIAATAEGMEILTRPLVARLAEKAGDKLQAAPRARKLASSQLGLVLAFLSGRVLGQFDPVVGTETDQGRLLLVAPNIMKVEQEIRADPRDFRMWVCLHESTHRLQFTAVPWLREYFIAQVAEFAEIADLDPGETLRRAAKALTSGGHWIERLQTPAQRVVFDRMMALMTLLEGHADHVMDAVGPTVVPTVASIRTGFSERRHKGRGPIDRLIRAMLGMDMKLAQYEKGAKFVAAIVDRAGMEGFNTIWTSPKTLPTRAETTDPQAWMARVL